MVIAVSLLALALVPAVADVEQGVHDQDLTVNLEVAKMAELWHGKNTLTLRVEDAQSYFGETVKMNLLCNVAVDVNMWAELTDWPEDVWLVLLPDANATKWSELAVDAAGTNKRWKGPLGAGDGNSLPDTFTKGTEGATDDWFAWSTVPSHGAPLPSAGPTKAGEAAVIYSSGKALVNQDDLNFHNLYTVWAAAGMAQPLEAGTASATFYYTVSAANDGG